MKTKKTAKIISSVLALVMLVCSLSAVSGFVTSAENEANTEAELVNALKTSWTKMYTNDFFATFNSANNRKSLSDNDKVNENPEVPADKLVDTGDDVLGFDIVKSGGYFTLSVYRSGTNYEYISLADAIKNYDNVTYSLYTGNVTQAGSIELVLKNPSENNIKAFTINLTTEDSGKWIDIDILKAFVCANMEAFLKLDTLNRMYISISGGLKAEGMILGMIAGKTFAKLPVSIDSMTALQLYNEAKNINTANYIDTADFTAARKALEDYLKPEILKDELKTAWGSMYSEKEIADLKTDMAVSSKSDTVNMSTMGITFNTDNTVSKTTSTHSERNVGIIFKNTDQWGSPWFNVSSRIVKFSDIFNDDNYDGLSVTINTGNVTSAGQVYLLCTYEDYNSIESKKIDITTEDNNKTITLEAKTLFGKRFSEMLVKETSSGTSALNTIKIGFSNSLAFEGATISGLSTINYAVVPNITDDELLAGKALRIDTGAYKNTAEFIEKKDSFYASLMTGKTLGDVNGLGDTNNICDLVALNDLVTSKDYNVDTTYSITGDMNTDGYITAADTALLRAELLR